MPPSSRATWTDASWWTSTTSPPSGPITRSNRFVRSSVVKMRCSTPSLPPGVEQRIFTTEDRTNLLLRVIGPEGGDVVLVHQDASVHVARLEGGIEVTHEIATGRGAYVY